MVCWTLKVYNPSKDYKRIVLRMGAFHICITYLAVIGKRYDDAGLRDTIIESGLVGSSAENGKN